MVVAVAMMACSSLLAHRLVQGDCTALHSSSDSTLAMVPAAVAAAVAMVAPPVVSASAASTALAPMLAAGPGGERNSAWSQLALALHFSTRVLAGVLFHSIRTAPGSSQNTAACCVPSKRWQGPLLDALKWLSLADASAMPLHRLQGSLQVLLPLWRAPLIEQSQGLQCCHCWRQRDHNPHRLKRL